MNPDDAPPPQVPTEQDTEAEKSTDHHCPVCGATLTQEKCKVVCRSPQCTYRIVFNCSEF
jgi:hypothetical protein